MKMDLSKIGLIFLMAFCLISATQFVFAAESMQADYLYPAEITDYRFLPSSITAGDTISVAIDVQNKGSLISIVDLNLSLDTGDYLEPILATNNINSIAANATKTSVLKFKVKDSTPAGYYQIFLNMSFKRVDYKGNSVDVNQTKVLTVPVVSSQKNLGIEVNPKAISPGKQTPLTISISNLSANPVSNVLLTWTDSSEVILPLGSDNRKFVSSINAGQTIDFDYLVVADPSITTGVYPITISISYNDPNGSKTQESEVGLIAGGKTDFQISADTTSSSGQVSFSIANIGSNNASAVIVQMPKQNGLAITGSDTVIIGTINKGDYSVANFTISASLTDQNLTQRTGVNPTGTNPPGINSPPVDSQADFNRAQAIQKVSSGNYLVDIYYTDTTGERQHVQSNFQLGSRTQATLGATGLRQQQSGVDLMLVGALAILVIAGVVYNKQVAKKDWKKLGIAIIIGIIVPVLIILFAPSSLSSTIFASVLLAGVLVVFFKKIGK